MSMRRNESSTLATLLVGDVEEAAHYRDHDDVTWIELTYADGRKLALQASGNRIGYVPFAIPESLKEKA